jgi:hypothetical protein
MQPTRHNCIKGSIGQTMPIVFRVGLLGLALAFGVVAVDAAAQGMGSGPIQTLPWAAKQRSKPNRDTQKGTEADAQPTPSSCAPTRLSVPARPTPSRRTSL